MNTKFSEGDHVRIVSSPYDIESLSVGKEGIILKIFGNEDDPSSYGVGMGDEMYPIGGWTFYEDELERV